MRSELKRKLYKQIIEDDEPLKITTVRFRKSDYDVFLKECRADSHSGSEILNAFVKVYKSGHIDTKKDK